MSQAELNKEMAYCTKVDNRVVGGEVIHIGSKNVLKIKNLKFLLSNSIREGFNLVKEENPLDYVKLFPKRQMALVNELGLSTLANYNGH